LNERILALRKDISKQVHYLDKISNRYGASDWPLWKIWLKVKGRSSKLGDFSEEELIIMREEKIPRISTLIKRSRPRPSSNIPPWARKKPRG
jgi:hypothetical protein